MSSPARDARLLAASKGFTQVIGRGNAHIITRNPVTKKCAYDGQVGGGWYYGAGLETDTAWLPGTAPWNYQMTKALYNVYALSNFSSGQIIKLVDPTSGQHVAFQPMALQWTNSLNQIQQISMPQSVAAQVSDDVLYWPSGYGSGRHFKYVASPSRLNKLLIIDSAASLPTTTYNTLELNFIMEMSSGVTAYIDSGSGLAAWDKITQKDTVKAIEFRLSNGTVVWSFAAPAAYDSSGNPETGFTTGSMRLKKKGSSLYVSVRFPKSWINAAQYPITIDPTIDYQVGANEENGEVYSYRNTHYVGYSFCWGKDSNGYTRSSYARWNVTIPAGATITASYLSLYGFANVGAGASARLYCEDVADASLPTSYANYYAKTRTTNYISLGLVTVGWWNTGSLNSVIQELVNSYNYAAGSHIQVLADQNTASANNSAWNRPWDYLDNTYGPKIHIEYTEAAGGTWAGTWGG